MYTQLLKFIIHSNSNAITEYNIRKIDGKCKSKRVVVLMVVVVCSLKFFSIIIFWLVVGFFLH